MQVISKAGGGFPARAIIFDLDGTLTPVKSPWRLVHEAFGTWDQAVTYHDQFFAGKIDYETWADKDSGLWSGRKLDDVLNVLNTIQPTQAALEVLPQVAAHRLADGSPVAMMILSSGFIGVAKRVLQQAGLPDGRVKVVANDVQQQNGRMVGVSNVALRHPERSKPAHVAHFLAEHGVTGHEAIAVDDRLQDKDDFSALGAFVHVETPEDLYRVLEFL